RSRARQVRLGAHRGRCRGGHVDAVSAGELHGPGRRYYRPPPRPRSGPDPPASLGEPMHAFATRAAGLLVPLFALRSERDWGIGEIGDLAAYCRWLGSAGHRFLQLLPIFEMPAGERSPYGALSTFAVDPIYLSLGEVEDFLEAGGEAMLPGPERAALDAARVETGIDYDRVRTVKRRALEIAFARFDLREWSTGSSRAARLREFAAAEADWLADYALFRARQERQAGASWTEWEP